MAVAARYPPTVRKGRSESSSRWWPQHFTVKDRMASIRRGSGVTFAVSWWFDWDFWWKAYGNLWNRLGKRHMIPDRRWSGYSPPIRPKEDSCVFVRPETGFLQSHKRSHETMAWRQPSRSHAKVNWCEMHLCLLCFVQIILYDTSSTSSSPNMSRTANHLQPESIPAPVSLPAHLQMLHQVPGSHPNEVPPGWP